MSARTTGPFLLLATLALAASACDAPGVGWPSTEAIDEDVARIQELARERVAAGEQAPSGPQAEMPTAAAAAPAEPEPAAVPEPEPQAPDATRGAPLYAQYCASCHGSGGHGDGPAGAALDPHPTDHTDGSYMNTLSNEHLFKVVAEGGASVGKSASMAPWGGVLSEEQIWNLVAYVRTLADPPYEGAVP